MWVLKAALEYSARAASALCLCHRKYPNLDLQSGKVEQFSGAWFGLRTTSDSSVWGQKQNAALHVSPSLIMRILVF